MHKIPSRFKMKYEILIIVLTLVSFTTAINSQQFIKLWYSQAKRGRCPNVASAQFNELEHFGLWYLTYTTMPFPVKCAASEVEPKSLGADVHTKAWLSDGTVYQFTLPGRAKSYYPGKFVARADVGGQFSMLLNIAVTTIDENSKLVWGCGNIHGGRYHIEYAEVYSKDLYTPRGRVYQFAEFLRQHGSTLDRFERVPSEKCSRIILSANSNFRAGKK